MTQQPPRILVIAGSDSSGGAGIQADIRTITMLGGYAMTAITALTAQNTQGVTAVDAVSPQMVAAQIDACLSDIGADAVKIGMLGTAEIGHVVADRLEQLSCPVVFDPVMIATSGAVLADSETIAAFERLMALATLTTPNVPELEALAGVAPIADEIALTDAAASVLQRTGASALLAKGGHWPGGEVRKRDLAGQFHSQATDDLLFDCLYCVTNEGLWQEWAFHHPRVDTRHTHGTGCTLASAIATELGRGLALNEAVQRAGDFVHAALLAAPGFGSGHGPLGHQAVGR